MTPGSTAASPAASVAASAPARLVPGDLRPIAHDGPPALCVVVDTEEEFDWSAPFSRDAVGVTAIAQVPSLQRVLEPFGIRPTYVVDYPVASTPASAESLAAIARDGRCEIGAHLHPWVTPPHVEAVTPRNSYACNLDEAIEHDKIASTSAAIERHLGVRPRVYKAGRYGIGHGTVRSLDALGFDVDVSVNPHWDFTPAGGPSFAGFDARPAWLGARRSLLEVPCTTGYVGAFRRAGEPVHRLATRPLLQAGRVPGVLSRTGLLNKVMLSPEGSSLDEMRQLTVALLADGVRTFSLTLHSTSLAPGCTPYVRTEADRQVFLSTIGRYCDFFFGLGGVSFTPAGLFDRLHAGDMG